MKRLRRAGSTGRAVDGAPRSALGDLRRLLDRCPDLDQLLDTLAARLAPLVPVGDRVSVVFLEPDGEWLRIYRVLPPADRTGGELPRRRVADTPVGEVVRRGVERVVSDVRSDPSITFGHAAHDGIRSTISVPIRAGGRVVGAMNAGSRTAGACTPDMLPRLAEVAAVVGPAILAAESAAARRERSPRAPMDAEADGLVGRGAAFRSMLAAARRAATSDADVLITGETGVGKTVLARAMHRWSARAAGPFVTVHLGDLAPTLIESELFGHERGAFTGADAGRVGRFESAQGGTIFFDEVSEAPLPIQSKLLRVVQDRRFERVGSVRTVEVDVRVIAATSRDLRGCVRRGEFREDLFYRLNVVSVDVPPLRARREDLEPLVASILARLGGPGGRTRRLAPGAWARLGDHAWPGNIRELESVLRRAAIFEEEDELALDGLPDPAGGGGWAAGSWPTLDEHERRYIARVLEHVDGKIEGPAGAAALLGLRPSTLRSLMKRLGVSAQPMRDRRRR